VIDIIAADIHVDEPSGLFDRITQAEWFWPMMVAIFLAIIFVSVWRRSPAVRYTGIVVLTVGVLWLMFGDRIT